MLSVAVALWAVALAGSGRPRDTDFSGPWRNSWTSM